MPLDDDQPLGSRPPPWTFPPRARRWGRRLALGAGALLAVPVAAVAIAWWWSGTEGSLATTLEWAGQRQSLATQNVTGALRSGGRIGRLKWDNGQGLAIAASDVHIVWHASSLFRGRLTLERLAADQLRVEDQRVKGTPSQGPPASLRLPLAINVKELALNQFEWTGPPSFAVQGLRARYAFTGTEHQIELAQASYDGGRYSGRASLGATAPLRLDATLQSVLQASVPGSTTRLPVIIDATVQGPLTELLARAVLQVQTQAPGSPGSSGSATPPSPSTPPPQAEVTARINPWAAQILPQAQAKFQDFNAALLWPEAPQTLLTGNATVQPAAHNAWRLVAQLTNAQPGPWDRQRLPVEQLEASGEWRDGQVLISALDARLGGGRLQASGQWEGGGSATPTPTPAPAPASPSTPASPPSASPAPAWTADAQISGVNLAALHTQMASQPVDGPLRLRNAADGLHFDTTLQAGRPVPGARNQATRNARRITQLRVRDLTARGTWRAEPEGGTLDLTALRLRTSDAQLSASGQFQPAAQGGRGQLALAAPGLAVQARGEARPTRGAGQLLLNASNLGQALNWLRQLPVAGPALATTFAEGNASAQLNWQGGWRDPAIQAQLKVPRLEMSTASKAEPKTEPGAPPLRLRAVEASLNGRISQAQLVMQGQLESGERRASLNLAAEGGATGPRTTPWAINTWQALVKDLRVAAQDPAVGKGPWRLQTQGDVRLSGAPGALDVSAGRAVLRPPANARATDEALLLWDAARWRPGEVITAGRLQGLPLAWIELVAGPQLTSLGLVDDLVFDGRWDARIGDALRLQAELTRRSGDLSLEAETLQGRATRVNAGLREARLIVTGEGDQLSAALRWDSERAGTAEALVRTRLQRAPVSSTPGTPASPDAQPQIGGWIWPQDAPLEGQISAQLPRIGAWSVLAPPGWRLRGALSTQLAIGGTRANPQLSGALLANDLALRSVVDGFEFGNGRLRARMEGTRMLIDEFTLQGAGERATGGRLVAQGEAGWVDGQPQVNMNVRLERLRASIRSDRQVTLSGQLRATLQGLLADITGALRIDQARIELPDESRPQLGSDVVVRGLPGSPVAREAREAPSTRATPPPGGRVTQLAVTLDMGNDFRVRGKGIDTGVGGSLTLAGDSLAAPRLIGTVSTVGGTYRAYGQRLNIEQGVLRFTGPLNNPALDILAIRPNLTQRVGVQISGTALLPQVRLYAQPDLPDAEKLSWLVVGRASASGGAEAALLQQAAVALLGSRAGGDSGGLAASLGLDELSFSRNNGSNGSVSGGAITLGKRFSSNFYAAYESSLSGAVGTLLVFYELSQRLTLRAQAGSQTAIDLIYTVPYD